MSVVEAPARPHWLTVVGVVLAALVCSGIAVGIAWIVVAFALDVPVSLADGGGSRTPDLWLRAGQVGEAAAAIGLLACFVRFGVRALIHPWDVRLGPTLLTIALASVAAILVASTGAPFVLATFTWLAGLATGLWRLALTSHPPRWIPRPAVAVPLALLAAGLAVATLSYGPLHPLSATFEQRSASSWTIVAHPRDRDPRTLDFLLGDDQDKTVTVRSMRVDDVPAGLVRVEGGLVDTSASGLWIDRLGPIAGLPLDDKQLLGRVRLLPAACASGQPRYRVARIEARVETVGLVRTQRFDVDPPAYLRCR